MSEVCLTCLCRDCAERIDYKCERCVLCSSEHGESGTPLRPLLRPCEDYRREVADLPDEVEPVADEGNPFDYGIKDCAVCHGAGCPACESRPLNEEGQS